MTPNNSYSEPVSVDRISFDRPNPDDQCANNTVITCRQLKPTSVSFANTLVVCRYHPITITNDKDDFVSLSKIERFARLYTHE